ncbi:zinc-dependent alcohol dehydrogenase [Capillimicrobium parvum]|uniref:zinc-dependent alcohol dehydrogenase n=1 Tax=Capillimicrobium parvum TaxID=2884022 RepID=UPI00216AB826|nr:alcohol dehydrogenase catalytic domain-containing protein [Capillimicrobium parvum]
MSVPPPTMQAVLLTAPEEIELAAMPVPEPGPGEVRVAVRAGGICGSDLSTYRGHHPFRVPPVVLGHEVSGVVEALGPGVTNLTPGDRVALLPLVACGSCEPCGRGETNLCTDRRVPGVGWAGTFSDWIVAPAALLYRVPGNVSFEAGALVEPAAVALRACRVGGVGAGTRLAVIGAGSIGTLVAMIARELGAGAPLVTDIKPFNLEMAGRLAGAHAVHAREDDLAAAGRRVSGGSGFDVLVIAAAAPDVVAEALALCRPGGVVVVVALFGEDVPLPVDQVVVRELQLRGSYVYTSRDFSDALGLIADGRLDVEALITRRTGFDSAPEVFASLVRGADELKVILQPADR